MSVIRRVAKQALWRASVYSLATRVRPWHGVAVLAYHGLRDASHTVLGTSDELHLRASVFDCHMRVLRALATPISLDDWRRARRENRPTPPRAVLVTIDDGYRSMLQLALPSLERYEVPAVAFVCTGPPQCGHLLWHDALERHGRGGEVEDAKLLPHDSWKQLVSECKLTAAPDDERAVMRPEEIAQLARHPLIEVGAHTVDHPILARAPVAVQRQQISDCITTLQEWTGVATRALAYPNGRPGADFTRETIAIVRDVGLDCAFSTDPRIATRDDAWEATPRFTMLDSISEAQLAHNLCISWARA